MWKQGRKPKAASRVRARALLLRAMASYASSSSITPQPQPQPDTDLIARLQARAKLKSKYARLQREYARALEVRDPSSASGLDNRKADALISKQTRKDLTLEVKEKEDKVQRLQDEVESVLWASWLPSLHLAEKRRRPFHFHSLVIEQIYDSDYAHLAPEDDDLFSDQEDEDEDAAPSMTGSPSVTRQDTNVAMDDEVQTSRPSEAVRWRL